MDLSISLETLDVLAESRKLSEAFELVFKYQDVLENLPANLTIGQVIELSRRDFDLAQQSATVAANMIHNEGVDDDKDLTQCDDLSARTAMVEGVNTVHELGSILRSVEGIHFWQQAEVLALVLNNPHIRQNWGKELRVEYNEETELLQVFLGEQELVELQSAECYEEFKVLFTGRVGCTVEPTLSNDGETIVSFVHGKVDPKIEIQRLDSAWERQTYQEHLALPKYAKCHLLREVCEKGPWGPYNERSDGSSVFLQVHGVDLVSFKQAGLSWLPKARKKRKEDLLRFKHETASRARLLLSRKGSDRVPWNRLFPLLGEEECA
jgi:hypothetical protein